MSLHTHQQNVTIAKSLLIDQIVSNILPLQNKQKMYLNIQILSRIKMYLYNWALTDLQEFFYM